MSDIYIIGVASQVPGAPNKDIFWENLKRGLVSISEIPTSRWRVSDWCHTSRYKTNKSISRWAGLLDQPFSFDKNCFNMQEVEYIEPQQRLLLESTYTCIEDAGLSIDCLRSNNTAVVIGSMVSEYRAVYNSIKNTIPISPSYSLGTFENMLANRISHFFGFTAESKTVNAACASSLVALHDAVDMLNRQDIDFVVIGAANVLLDPKRNVSFSKAGMLSPEGLCKTFQVDAAGYVPGEGVVTFLLANEATVKKYRAHTYVKITSVAVNHSGHTSAITAPSIDAQIELLKKAYKGIDISRVGYIEAHGTGTSLGDPIEIAALHNFFVPSLRHGRFVGLVKQNIGHLEPVSGFAGLLKCIYILKHRFIPKGVFSNKLNPLLNSTTFSLNLDAVNLKENDIVGLSSFGFGGANAHAVLEGVKQNKKNWIFNIFSEKNNPQKKFFFVLSARSPASLKALTHSWQDFLSLPLESSPALEDATHTLLTGREYYEYRVGFFVDSYGQVRSKLSFSGENLNHIELFVSRKMLTVLQKI